MAYYFYYNYLMRLRTPGQRLPSPSRLITYRIACKSPMLDNEEPNDINMRAPPRIMTINELKRNNIHSDSTIIQYEYSYKVYDNKQR